MSMGYSSRLLISHRVPSCLFSTASTSSSTQSSHKQHNKSPSRSLIDRAIHPKEFKFTDALVRHLKQSLVLHEPGRFMIVQKPYGVSCLGFKHKEGGVFKNSVHNSLDDEEEGRRRQEDEEGIGRIESLDKSVTIADCIPQLSKIFNEPHLGFFTGLKRYVSGPLILPCTKVEYDLMKKSVRSLSNLSIPDEKVYQHSALVICVGTPPSEEGSLHGYATFQPVSGHKEYIFVEGPAKKRQKTGKYAVEGEIEWKTIATGHGCSLLQIHCSKFARHLPRLALAHIDCPILGDSIYHKRVFDVDGRPVRMEPSKAARNKGKRYIPHDLLSHTGLTPSDLSSLPIYLHVWQTVLPRYGKAKRVEDETDLVASSPPPEHFSAMVEALGYSKQLDKFWNENDEPIDLD